MPSVARTWTSVPSELGRYAAYEPPGPPSAPTASTKTTFGARRAASWATIWLISWYRTDGGDDVRGGHHVDHRLARGDGQRVSPDPEAHRLGGRVGELGRWGRRRGGRRGGTRAVGRGGRQRRAGQGEVDVVVAAPTD